MTPHRRAEPAAHLSHPPSLRDHGISAPCALQGSSRRYYYTAYVSTISKSMRSTTPTRSYGTYDTLQGHALVRYEQGVCVYVTDNNPYILYIVCEQR